MAEVVSDHGTANAGSAEGNGSLEVSGGENPHPHPSMSATPNEGSSDLHVFPSVVAVENLDNRLPPDCSPVRLSSSSGIPDGSLAVFALPRRPRGLHDLLSDYFTPKNTRRSRNSQRTGMLVSLPPSSMAGPVTATAVQPSTTSLPPLPVTQPKAPRLVKRVGTMLKSSKSGGNKSKLLNEPKMPVSLGDGQKKSVVPKCYRNEPKSSKSRKSSQSVPILASIEPKTAARKNCATTTPGRGRKAKTVTPVSKKFVIPKCYRNEPKSVGNRKSSQSLPLLALIKPKTAARKNCAIATPGRAQRAKTVTPVQNAATKLDFGGAAWPPVVAEPTVKTPRHPCVRKTNNPAKRKTDESLEGQDGSSSQTAAVDGERKRRSRTFTQPHWHQFTDASRSVKNQAVSDDRARTRSVGPIPVPLAGGSRLDEVAMIMDDLLQTDQLQEKERAATAADPTNGSTVSNGDETSSPLASLLTENRREDHSTGPRPGCSVGEISSDEDEDLLDDSEDETEMMDKLYAKIRSRALKSIPMVDESYDGPLPPRIHLGSYKITSQHTSLFPDEYLRCECLYICEFCLQYMKTVGVMQRHYEKCIWHRPPGTEIYHDFFGGNGSAATELIIYEVDGHEDYRYCQNLSLLGGLFIDTKILYYDVETFLFYVLTQRDTYGDHIIGYFSKTKRGDNGFNLACFMVLPPYQGAGYGRILIDFSYFLSRTDGSTGTPEKPLSTMGQISYSAYWKSVVLDFFLDQLAQSATKTSIKAICDTTGLMAQDVADTLEAIGFIRKRPDSNDREFSLMTPVLSAYSEKTKNAPNKRLVLVPEKLRHTAWRKPLDPVD